MALKSAAIKVEEAYPACTAQRAQAEEHKQRPCALRCKGCKNIISPPNPSHQTAQSLMQATMEPELMELVLTGEGSSHGSKRSNTAATEKRLNASVPATARPSQGIHQVCHHS
eukprot:30738-Pelagomonas_calceolata.AAC.3